MFSYALSTATTYFHLPVDEDEDKDIACYQRKYLTWTSEPSIPDTPSPSPIDPAPSSQTDQVIEERAKTLHSVLANDDLYDVLGISRTGSFDKVTLRRAYLLRSKVCHPDKFPADKARATLAFQKIAVAYDVLSKPSSRRLYDCRSPSSNFDAFAVRPTGYAEQTFRNAVIGVFNDFLDGDLEVVRTLLKAISDLNPSLTLGDDGMNAVLTALQSIRERALTCRTCIFTLHAELSRLIEVQQELRQLSYFDLFGRSRLTIQLTRITLCLPIALERALEEQNAIYGTGPPPDPESGSIIPRHLNVLIRSVDVALEKMERILK